MNEIPLDNLNCLPTTSWQNRTPSFRRTVNALFKKLFLIKIRHIASIIEFAISMIIYLAMIPIYILARETYEGSRYPMIEDSMISVDMAMFLTRTENITKLILMPDNNLIRTLVYPIFSLAINQIVATIPTVKINLSIINDVETMKNYIYESADNAFAVYWKNSEAPDAFTSPVIETYQQTFGASPKYEILVLMRKIISGYAMMTNPAATDIFMMNSHRQTFAAPELVNIYNVHIAIALFAIFPIILSAMPDFQIILEEKDSKITAFSYLMGCSESAYWLVAFVNSFILSLIPYICMCLMFVYGVMLVGSDISYLLVISIFFIIGHLWFCFFLSTFMKKGANGRALTVILLVLIIFFSYLHFYFTLDENNSSEAVKHIFSLLPFSAYQMAIMSIYKEVKLEQHPIKWSDFYRDMSYPPCYAFSWLLADCFIYFLLFLLFNATNKREFGTPIIKWSEIFNKQAWIRVFEKESLDKVASTSEKFLEVEGLYKTYHGSKDIEALKNINIEVKTNEVIVLIGPNGAGKSTLINVLSGAIEPSEGIMRLYGGDSTTRFKEVQKYLGIVFQDNVIINLLSVKEHLHLFGAFRGINEDDLEQSIDFFAHTLQLTDMLDNRAGDLSGGQKRKLCIALSLLGNPPIVIMDEPTAGVDVQARQLIWKTIASLSNTTSIITSHALEEAEAVSSRLFIMSKGSIPFCGTSTELRNQFKCGYVLRVEREDGSVGPVLDLATSFIPDARMADERSDTILLPVDSAVPSFLTELAKKKEEYEIISFSFSVEQLEDMLIKLIQTEEAAYHGIE